MSVFTIKMDVLAGSDLKITVEEAKEKAYLLDVAYVCFDFNGTSMSINRYADSGKVYKAYMKEQPDFMINECCLSSRRKRKL